MSTHNSADVIALLEEALEVAKSGNIHSIFIVSLCPNDIDTMACSHNQCFTRLLGAIEQSKHTLIREHSNNPERG